MAKSKQSRDDRAEIDDRLTADDVAKHLEALARGLRDGRLTVDGTGFEAETAGDIDFELSARRRKRRGRIEVSLRFRLNRDDTSEEGETEGDASVKNDQAPATLPDRFSF